VKINDKYLKRLALYSKWEQCRTPLEQFSGFLGSFWLQDEPLFAAKSPEDAIYTYESLGIKWPTTDEYILGILWSGKAKRDWWAKEIREWFRLGSGDPIFAIYEFYNMFPRPECRREVTSWWLIQNRKK
jgi:hypothetical protein